ncbi:MAG: hypothetical protein IPP19_14105 [Verrucomicrobia bacterium]|nr:hypothetical protein [Verrucomicrobiota bacterium]
MNSRLKSALLVLFALTTVATGILAWQQYRALHAPQSESSQDDDALRQKLADAEHRTHALQNELDALKARTSSEDVAPPDEPPPTANNNERRGRRGPGGGPAAFMALMNDPKVVQLMNSRDRLMLDTRYAALFKSLLQGSNLNLQQIDAFKDLLVEKQNTTRDFMMSSRAEGVTDRNEVNKLINAAQAELDAQIQNTLGAAGFAEYQQYENTLPQRNLVTQLSQNLSYTSAPLSDAQSQQLIKILSENSGSADTHQPRNLGGFGGGPGGMGAPFGSSTAISDAAIAQAQAVLAPAQLQALTTLQQQQKAQQEIMNTIHAAQQNPSAPATPNTPKVAK